MVTKKLSIPVLPLLILCGIVTSTVSAQDSSSTRSFAAGSRSNAKSTVAGDITVTGTIQQVPSERTPGSPAGLHLLVNSPHGLLDTSVGPFLTDEARQALSSGQQVQVVGFIQAINGSNYLLARQLVVAGRQIQIRNENGFFIHNQSHTGNRSPRNQSEPNGGIQ
jgi:hypothetical protein